MAKFIPLSLVGAYEILPDVFGDDRGFFSETYSANQFLENGMEFDFVQDNHSFSKQKGVLRGLHCQTAPFAQDKLVRVTRGRVLDVLVDVRKGSPTYKNWVSVEVSAEKWNQVFVPKGFLHGFMTLEANTEFLYKVTAPYAPDYDHSVRFDDPDIGIDWPIADVELTLSDKDQNAPSLSELDLGFVFGDTK